MMNFPGGDLGNSNLEQFDLSVTLIFTCDDCQDRGSHPSVSGT